MALSGIGRGRVVVIGRSFRIFHFLLFLGLFFLAYTALFLDDDGDSESRLVSMLYFHKYVGLAWGAMIILYSLITLLRKRPTILEPLGRPILEQIREGFSVIGRYFFGRPHSELVRSKMGRHNVMASYAFLMLVVGILLLGIGGVGLVMSPHSGDSLDFLLGIHIAGAGLIALFVLAHFFAVMNGENRPLLRAVFTSGKVDREWLSKSMPKYQGEKFYTSRRR